MIIEFEIFEYEKKYTAYHCRMRRMVIIPILLDLAENAEKYRIDPDAKPPFSYATIICLAMRANNNKVSLSNIYAWIRENFLFYKYADPAWQVKSRISVFLNFSLL